MEMGGTRRLNRHYQSSQDMGGALMIVAPTFPAAGKSNVETGYRGHYAWIWGRYEYSERGPVFIKNSADVIGRTAADLSALADRMSSNNYSGYYSFIRAVGATGIDLSSDSVYYGAPNIYAICGGNRNKPYKIKLESTTHKFELIIKDSDSNGIAVMKYGDGAKVLALFEAIAAADVSNRKGYVYEGGTYREATEEDDPTTVIKGNTPADGFYLIAGRFSYQQVLKDRQTIYPQSMIYNAGTFLPETEIVL